MWKRENGILLSEKLLEFSLVGAEWVLWLLIALSALSIAVMVDRLILYATTRERIASFVSTMTDALRRGDFREARDVCTGNSLVRRTLSAGLELLAEGGVDRGQVQQAMIGALARQRARYDARLTVLGTIGNNAPFVGLFGTVLGIIQAFHELGQSGPESGASNQLLMAAIGEALVATGVGILVAIPAVAAFNAAKSHVAGRIRQAESLMGSVLAGLGENPTDGEEV